MRYPRKKGIMEELVSVFPIFTAGHVIMWSVGFCIMAFATLDVAAGALFGGIMAGCFFVTCLLRAVVWLLSSD